MSLRKSLVAGLNMLKCLIILFVCLFPGAKLASLVFYSVISRRLKRTGVWRLYLNAV